MNILESITLGCCVMLALLSSSSQATPNQSSDPASALPATTFFLGQSASLVTQRNNFSEIPASWKGSANRNSNLENTKNLSAHAENFRVNNLSIGIIQTQMFIRNDRATLSLYAPTPAVNRSLSFAKIISNSQMDGVWVTAVQALALTENRQLNTEFAYTVPAGKAGKLDSAVSYQLTPITDSGKPGFAASLQYKSKF